MNPNFVQRMAAEHGADFVSPASLRLYVRVLEFYQRRRPPTVRDLCDSLGLSPNAVQESVNRLRSGGLLAGEYGKSRAMRPAYRLELFAGEVGGGGAA